MTHLSIVITILMLSTASGVLQIPALGRPADLFYFYNINKDQFYPVSSLNGHIPPQGILSQIRGNVQCTSKIVKSLDDRLSSIGLDLRTKLDVMTGVAGMAGSISYAKQTQFDTESIYGVVHYRRYTMYEAVHTRLEEVQSLISTYPARILPATHIVTGVMWGVDLAISFRFHGSSGRSKSKISADAEMSLKKLAYSVEFGSKFETGTSNKQETTDIEIKVFGDIFLPTIPKSVEEAEALLQDIPQIMKLNNEKGTPQYFHIIEVTKLQGIIDYDLLQQDTNSSKSQGILDRDPNLVEVESILLTLYQDKEGKDFLLWQQQFQKYDFLFDNDFLHKIDLFCREYEIIFSVYDAKFKIILHQGRSKMTKKIKKNFYTTKNEYDDLDFGPVFSQVRFNDLVKNAKTKINDYNAFQNSNVNFACKDLTTNQLRLQNFNETVYFLFYTEQWKAEYPFVWQEISNWFVHQSGLRFVVDCNLTIHFEHSCPALNSKATGGKPYAVKYDKKAKLQKVDIKIWLNDAVQYMTVSWVFTLLVFAR